MDISSQGPRPKVKTDLLRIGQVAERAGVATSALRFYEDEGLIESIRDDANVRRYARSVLRRVAFIQAAQRIGVSLDEIREALESLPNNRTPTRADWAGLSRSWKPRIDRRIEELEALRDELIDCIGCGCLSLKSCALYNTQDILSAQGPGARRWKASGIA